MLEHAANTPSPREGTAVPAPEQAAFALLALPTDELTRRAREVRAATMGTQVTYSPKVFIPLTRLCRDRCGYCTFATAPRSLPAPYLTPQEVLEIDLGGNIEPSFLAEVMAHDIVRSPFGTYADELVLFFTNAADRINGTFTDPAGLGGDVNNMTPTQRLLAKTALLQARSIAERAVDLADDGQERAAVTEWRKLFGNRMPNP